jgi:hypothetical protein
MSIDRFKRSGLPGHAADRLALMEWHLARRTWTKADAERALVAEHGPERAREMLGNAAHMLKRIRKDPWGAQRMKSWAGPTGAGLHHPELTAALDWLLSQVRPDNVHWCGWTRRSTTTRRPRRRPKGRGGAAPAARGGRGGSAREPTRRRWSTRTGGGASCDTLLAALRVPRRRA